MTTTNAAYLVISQNPNNSELDCVDEFDSFTEACEFAEGVRLRGCGSQRLPAQGLARRVVQRLALRNGSELRGITNLAERPAQFFENQRDEGPKLDTSGKPEPSADKASRGREGRRNG